VKRPWLLYLVLIFGLASIPGHSGLKRAPRYLDKVAHLLLYAGFGMVYVQSADPKERSRRGLLLMAVGLSAAVGLTDELYQGLVPNRSQETADWLTDLAGGFCGASLALGHRRVARKDEGRNKA